MEEMCKLPSKVIIPSKQLVICPSYEWVPPICGIIYIKITIDEFFLAGCMKGGVGGYFL